jgi:3-hexulose-6-phosphate synthase/6-phospho-3-hexuloisomerase
MDPIVQVSIDLMTIEDALPVADVAVRAGVDWLEVGTPLILGEGLHAVREFKEHWPDHPVVADLKTMDAGFLEAEMMAKAGADLVVVMGVAHWSTIAGAVRAGREYGIKVMGDIMLAEDKPAMARRIEELGADYVIVHTGFDERGAEVGKSPLDDVRAVVEAVSIPVQAVGGLSVEQAIQMPSLGAPLVVIGAPLVIDGEEFAPGDTEDKLYELLRHIVTEVKKQGSGGGAA